MVSQMLQNSTTYIYFPQDLFYSTTRIFIQIRSKFQPLPLWVRLLCFRFRLGKREKRGLQLEQITQACSGNDGTIPGAIEFVISQLVDRAGLAIRSRVLNKQRGFC